PPRPRTRKGILIVNPIPASDLPPPVPHGTEQPTVPRQQSQGYGERLTSTRRPGPDPLDHPDPARAADAASVENLLRCWAREHAPAGPPGAALRTPLPRGGPALLVPVGSWPPTGLPRLGPPFLENPPPDAPAAEAVTVAALLGHESGR